MSQKTGQLQWNFKPLQEVMNWFIYLFCQCLLKALVFSIRPIVSNHKDDSSHPSVTLHLFLRDIVYTVVLVKQANNHCSDFLIYKINYPLQVHTKADAEWVKVSFLWVSRYYVLWCYIDSFCVAFNPTTAGSFSVVIFL